jgi:hypothetical protein
VFAGYARRQPFPAQVEPRQCAPDLARENNALPRCLWGINADGNLALGASVTPASGFFVGEHHGRGGPAQSESQNNLRHRACDRLNTVVAGLIERGGSLPGASSTPSASYAP